MAPPQLGATFVPGGFDDYYMPEVVAPSPQRYVALTLSLSVSSRRLFPPTAPLSPFPAFAFPLSLSSVRVPQIPGPFVSLDLAQSGHNGERWGALTIL